MQKAAQQHFRPGYTPTRQPATPRRHTPTITPETIRAAIPSGRAVRITFEIDEVHAPALRSAIDEISQEIGGRLEGPHTYAREAALTNAAVCLGTLRAAVNAKVPFADPDYDHK